ncbi:EAL domain-containing protein [Azohydromonas australica]|uniref:EAL domain-containing protein n=1 Tax=Azohydromonas australica TaxID=364039 RepID=UPI000427EDF2|nr:EAL domain-containing protein [Azohydromonas australica]
MLYPTGSPPLFEDATSGHLLVRSDGLVVRVNRLFAQWCGRLPEQIEQQLRLLDLLTPGSQIFHNTHYVPLLKLQGFAHEISFDLSLPGGTTVPVLLNAQAFDAQGEWPALTSVTVFNASVTRRYEAMLKTAQRQAEQALDELAERNVQLQQQQERLRVTLQSMTDAVVTVDAAGQIDLLNPAALVLLESEEAHVLGRPFSDVVALLWADDRQPRQCPVNECLVQHEPQRQARDSLVRVGGGQRLCRVNDTVAPIRDTHGHCIGAIWVCRDVSAQRHLAERAAYITHHDVLTGLPNRREFEQELVRSDTALPPGLLCYIDLDQFKVINDTLGHAAGDALLREIALLLRDGVRQSDLLARLGGDEFGLLLRGCSVEGGMQWAQVLRGRIEAYRFHWEGTVHAVTASIGLAPLGGEREQAYAVLINADIACHAAKEAGRNRVQFVDSADTQLQRRRSEMHWVTRLQRALAEDRFELFFQPIVSTAQAQAQGTASHGEILLRLRSEDGQLVLPAFFIPAAERYQLMSALDRHVLRKSFAWMQDTPDVTCSINISGQSLGDGGFLQDVASMIESSGVDPRRLCFEITETAAIGNLESAQAFIARFSTLGVRFALDDFGVGLSSFAYLHSLKADLLKIDGSFVRGLHRDPQRRVIVESLHRVASAFNMRTVAEWVENDTILSELCTIGIDYAQGYFTGRPIPVRDWKNT